MQFSATGSSWGCCCALICENRETSDTSEPRPRGNSQTSQPDENNQLDKIFKKPYETGEPSDSSHNIVTVGEIEILL